MRGMAIQLPMSFRACGDVPAASRTGSIGILLHIPLYARRSVTISRVDTACPSPNTTIPGWTVRDVGLESADCTAIEDQHSGSATLWTMAYV